jgi:hypothetical protein
MSYSKSIIDDILAAFALLREPLIRPPRLSKAGMMRGQSPRSIGQMLLKSLKNLTTTSRLMISSRPKRQRPLHSDMPLTNCIACPLMTFIAPT